MRVTRTYDCVGLSYTVMTSVSERERKRGRNGDEAGGVIKTLTGIYR